MQIRNVPPWVLNTHLFLGRKVIGQGHEAQKQCRRGSLHSCECWLSGCLRCMFSEFYAKLQRSKTGCAHSKQSLTPARLAKESQNHVNSPSTSSPSSSSSSWSTNPLMLTTIVALSIAVVATLVILPLVLCVQVRQRCTGKPAPGAPVARQQNTSPADYNAVEKGTATAPSKLSSSPIYVPRNELKEKSGTLFTFYTRRRQSIAGLRRTPSFVCLFVYSTNHHCKLGIEMFYHESWITHFFWGSEIKRQGHEAHSAGMGVCTLVSAGFY